MRIFRSFNSMCLTIFWASNEGERVRQRLEIYRLCVCFKLKFNSKRSVVVSFIRFFPSISLYLYCFYPHSIVGDPFGIFAILRYNTKTNNNKKKRNTIGKNSISSVKTNKTVQIDWSKGATHTYAETTKKNDREIWLYIYIYIGKIAVECLHNTTFYLFNVIDLFNKALNGCLFSLIPSRSTPCWDFHFVSFVSKLSQLYHPPPRTIADCVISWLHITLNAILFFTTCRYLFE